ncbi:MAG: hypothetical protein ACPGSW_04530 [Phaeobacter italicus]
MDQVVDYLKATEIVIGLLVLVFSTFLGVFVWWDRRARAYTDRRTYDFQKSSDRVVERLSTLEANVVVLERDVSAIKRQVETLPTMSDYTEIKVQVADSAATLRQVNGMVQTLYKAAMRASEGQG